MKHVLAAALLASTVAAPTLALAQPQGEADKGDAKALLASGLKLFSAKDYLGALSVFETAYERYPSPKILLNIGTTLLKLDRKVDAANIYQRYLDAKDVDAKKQTEAKKILAALDKELAVLEIAVTPDNAEIQIAGGKWMSLDTVRKTRVAKGEVTVLARAPRFKLRAETITVSAGETRSLALTLDEEPAPVITSTQSTGATTATGTGVTARVVPATRSKLAALVAWHVDPLHESESFPVGSTVLVGATFDLTPQLSLQGAALIGNYFGPYVGARYAFLPGRVRPVLAVGAPILFANGPRVSVRGAAGVELVINRNLAVIVEAGVERLLNAEDDIMNETLFVPSLGLTGRL